MDKIANAVVKAFGGKPNGTAADIEPQFWVAELK